MLQNKNVLLIFRLIVGGVFIWAGVSKIADPLSFAQDVRNYQLVGPALSFLTAIFLPWVELIAGLWLIIGIYPKSSALLISSLLLFFIVLVLITMARGLDVDCGCFGTFSRQADWRLIAEDSLWLALSLALLFSPANDFCLLRKKSSKA
ncbi:MAG TPA: MauE/DoxX family redox-associated membrane protein [Candidatus Saccharicenans sp.]|nr:MauE/DoxX family redox-associated membrane protein [Candidatus Saccharicenans sp.]